MSLAFHEPGTEVTQEDRLLGKGGDSGCLG